MSLFSDHGDVSPTELDGTTDVAALEDAMLEQSPSNSVHSNQETEPHSELQQKVSSLELENKLLKNEVASLNQEMATVLQRSKDAQNGKWINLRFQKVHYCSLQYKSRCKLSNYCYCIPLVLIKPQSFLDIFSNNSIYFCIDNCNVLLIIFSKN